MKDFDKPIPQSEEIEIHSQTQQEARLVIQNQRLHKGHTMFEINCTTGEIKPAKYEETNASFVSGSMRRKILCNENCLYVGALNKKSVKKKFLKYFLQNISNQIKESNEPRTIA